MPLDHDPVVQPESAATVRLRGELDYTTARAIVDGVRAALAQGAHAVLLDLAAVDFMSAAALGAVVRARNTCRRHDAVLSVRCGDRRTRHLFAITGLDGLLEPEASPAAR